MKPNIFALQSICMKVSISLLYLFVHEPLYQTVVVCCNSVSCYGSLHMDCRAVSILEWGLPLRLAQILNIKCLATALLSAPYKT